MADYSSVLILSELLIIFCAAFFSIQKLQDYIDFEIAEKNFKKIKDKQIDIQNNIEVYKSFLNKIIANNSNKFISDAANLKMKELTNKVDIINKSSNNIEFINEKNIFLNGKFLMFYISMIFSYNFIFLIYITIGYNTYEPENLLFLFNIITFLMLFSFYYLRQVIDIEFFYKIFIIILLDVSLIVISGYLNKLLILNKVQENLSFINLDSLRFINFLLFFTQIAHPHLIYHFIFKSQNEHLKELEMLDNSLKNEIENNNKFL